MKAKPGHKWIITLTLPESKQKFVCGGMEGKLTLFPIAEVPTQKLKNVLAWDDSVAAHNWMKGLLRRLGNERGKQFLLMMPDLKQISIIQ